MRCHSHRRTYLSDELSSSDSSGCGDSGTVVRDTTGVGLMSGGPDFEALTRPPTNSTKPSLRCIRNIR